MQLGGWNCIKLSWVTGKNRFGGGIPDFAFGYFNVVLTSEHPNGDGEIS